MGKLERQQKKLEAMQEKAARKQEKAAARQAKKEAKASGKKRKEKSVPKINIRAERAEVVDEGVEFKPKNTSWKKAVAIILWLIIAFFVAQGILAVMNRETSADLKRTMNNHYSNLTDMEASQMEAGTFTASFLREYYTFDTENNTWNERVGKYLASGTILDEPSGVDTETPESITIRKIAVNEKAIDVDAYVEVHYKSTTNDGENTVEKEGVLKHMIRVPLEKKDDSYAVISSPIYIADTNRASQVESTTLLEGDNVDSNTLSVLETTAGNFLKAYYGKKPSELKYYVTNDFGTLVTVGGNMKFVKVSECQAVKHRGGYTVKVNAVVNNGFNDVTESMVLEMVKGDEGRLYISEIKTRQ